MSLGCNNIRQLPRIEASISFSHLSVTHRTAAELLADGFNEPCDDCALKLSAAALHYARAEYFIGQAAAINPHSVHNVASSAVEQIIGLSSRLGQTESALQRWQQYAADNGYGPDFSNSDFVATGAVQQ